MGPKFLDGSKNLSKICNSIHDDNSEKPIHIEVVSVEIVNEMDDSIASVDENVSEIPWQRDPWYCQPCVLGSDQSLPTPAQAPVSNNISEITHDPHSTDMLQDDQMITRGLQRQNLNPRTDPYEPTSHPHSLTPFHDTLETVQQDQPSQPRVSPTSRPPPPVSFSQASFIFSS